jgi:6 kDa early secretory antigenic target
MVSFTVTTSEVAVAVQALTSATNAIQASLDDLASKINAHTAEWEGDAVGAYLAAKAKWDAACGDMRTMLAGLGTRIDGSGQHYDTTERRNTAAFGG